MTISETSAKEKLTAALGSVVSGVILTATKIVVGLMTGSLGIIAEAAHSSLDLIAAVITYFAVYFSNKPADKEHLYGHGKIENFSALIETLLLLGTCGWIAHEAIERLFFRDVKVEASGWAFAVVILSIAIDVYRSRKLMEAAIKHKSQALEADALHFSTDIWSSVVVLFGLFCVKIAEWFPTYVFLHMADAVAALLVAVIVIGVSYKLGVKTIKALIDATPEGIIDSVKKSAESVPGVTACNRIRARYSGPNLFIDVHVHMDGNQTLYEAHLLMDKVEERINEVFPGADVTVHAEPA
jgi:cation diffusion facilitator family transporter